MPEQRKAPVRNLRTGENLIESNITSFMPKKMWLLGIMVSLASIEAGFPNRGEIRPVHKDHRGFFANTRLSDLAFEFLGFR